MRLKLCVELIVLTGLVLVFAAASHLRNTVWKDGLSLWSDVAGKSPHNARAHNNVGNALARVGSLDEAIAHYSAALQIKPDYAEAHNNLGLALAKQGSVNEAIAHYSAALQMKPDSAEAHNNLGLALAEQGSVNEAIAHYSAALQKKPY